MEAALLAAPALFASAAQACISCEYVPEVVRGSQTSDAPPAVSLSAADATLVRDFLVRRSGLEPSARADLARRLARALAQRYQLPQDPAATDPEAFLERLV